MKLWLMLGLAAVCRAAITPRPTQTYPHQAVLDPDRDYHLFWKHDTASDQLIFEVHVNTLGWVGFGMSTSGGMDGADIVVAWVDSSGNGYFHDTHAHSPGRPSADTEANWHLLEARQSGGVTIVKFHRHISSCDTSGQDFQIEDGTQRLIYAYGPQTPTSLGQLPKHASNRRGTLSIRLLEPEGQRPSLPNDAISVDFTMTNQQVPTDATTYWCEMYRFPTLATKHHIIKIEPIVTPGNERLVHHVLLYRCPQNTNISLVGASDRCYRGGNMPEHECEELFGAWAIGGMAQHYPAHAGYPVGGTEGPDVILMEMHYDNPLQWSNYTDSSGLRVHMTPTLRRHDAGVLFTGRFSSPDLAIPPFVPAFNVDSWCPKECLTQAMSGVTPKINVFGVVLHAHLLGRKIAARVIRNGREIGNIGVDNYYDFNFQEYRALPQEVEIRPGDTIMTECQMDSSGRSVFTYGGLGTSEEMCLTFAWYYPRIPLNTCQVGNSEVGLMKLFGAHNATYDSTRRAWVVDHPRHLQNKTVSELAALVDWANATVVQAYVDNVPNTDYSTYCQSAHHFQYNVSVPKPRYTPAPAPGTPQHCTQTTSGSAQLLLSVVLHALIFSFILLLH